MDNEKLTIDGKEYTLANIKSIKINNEHININESNLSNNILLTPEILNKEIVNLSIQIDKI